MLAPIAAPRHHLVGLGEDCEAHRAAHGDPWLQRRGVERLDG
jgi:hypothetical protein